MYVYMLSLTPSIKFGFVDPMLCWVPSRSEFHSACPVTNLPSSSVTSSVTNAITISVAISMIVSIPS